MTTKSYLWIVIVLGCLIGVYTWLTKPTSNIIPPAPPIRMDKMTQGVLRANWDQVIATACKPQRGNATAKWTMVEIGDFQCPQCGKARPDVEKLIDGSGGKVQLRFLNWPLQMHSHARQAAAAALAAENQGKFWQMFDAIYEGQDKLESPDTKVAVQSLDDAAFNLGLNMTKFKADCVSEDTIKRLHSQEMLAMTINTQSTPTFLLREAGSQTIYFFIGTIGQAATPTTPKYPGLKDLAAAQPWAGGKLAPPIDGPSSQPQQEILPSDTLGNSAGPKSGPAASGPPAATGPPAAPSAPH